MSVILGVSNRHLHLTEEDYIILFGTEPMEKAEDLYQPEEYITNKTVTVKTNTGIIENVPIIGPLRDYTKLELSMTDFYYLGFEDNPQDLCNKTGGVTVTIIGSWGEITKPCAIVSERHIHLNKDDYQRLGLTGKTEVSISIPGAKSAILNHVKLKITPNARLECHLDTDDANACLVKSGMFIDILDD